MLLCFVNTLTFRFFLSLFISFFLHSLHSPQAFYPAATHCAPRNYTARVHWDLCDSLFLWLVCICHSRLLLFCIYIQILTSTTFCCCKQGTWCVCYNCLISAHLPQRPFSFICSGHILLSFMNTGRLSN